jgi:2-dehydro-3-deoxyphosphogluconate aldolase / (4S)-4-hydroxy-2-oxoglutarate aldolase
MEKQRVSHLIRTEGFIPVVRVPTSEEALEVAAALREGGARLVEITFTVHGAVDVIRELHRRYRDEMVVGAGTVLDVESASNAFHAGAGFLVSPAFDADVVRFAGRNSLLVIPGAMTPTEILNAWKAGADMVKVFPAARLGGPEYIRNIRGPLPGIPLVPTGGVDLANVSSYIKAGAAAVGVGGELAGRKAVSERRFDLITESVKAFLRSVREAQAG